MNSRATHTQYEFEGFVIDPARRLLNFKDGRAVAINAKAFDALAYLVEHAGQVVARADLSAALWPNTVVEDNNLSQTILALRRVLGDSETGRRYIVTVPRRGYQFVAEVTEVVKSGNGAAGPAATVDLGKPQQSPASSRRIVFAVAVGMVLIASALMLALMLRSPGTEAVDLQPHSVAVLPFENLSPNPEDAYFAAGMHEEVLGRLAKLRGVTVIARTSVMQFANAEAMPITSIARALNVATVMEGSVRYAQDRVRVSVRLVDGASGRDLWSETYDAELRDVFDIQSDIATQIVAALESELTPAEVTRLSAKPTSSAEAYASYLKALVLYRFSGSIGVSMPTEARRTIQGHLDQAIALDPKFAAALGWRAHMAIDSLNFDSFSAQERAERADSLAHAVQRDATEALDLDPTLGIAHAALSRLHTYQFELEDALQVLEAAQKLTPNDTVVWQASAVLHCVRNEPEAAIRAARRAIELDPRNAGPYSLLSIGLRAKGDYAAAISAYERMIELAPTAIIGYVGLARTLTSQGDTPRLRDTLKLAEQFLGGLRNFRVDLALSYASIGGHDDARRLIDEFRRNTEGQYIDPALLAMSHLALQEYAQAEAVLREAIAMQRRGMDQMPLALIRYNSWSDPELERPEWVHLRAQLEYRRAL